MKKIYIVVLGALLICNLSCSRDAISFSQEGSLVVKAEIGSDKAHTKAIVGGGAFPVGTSIGVEVLKEDNSIYRSGFSVNLQYTVDAVGAWSSPDYCALTPVKGKVYGYYPYVASFDSSTPFFSIPVSVPATAQESDVTDYMYAEPIEDPADLVYHLNSSINLTMRHGLAQVSLLVYKENYSGAGSFTDFTVESVNGSSHIIVDNSPINDLVMSITDGAISGGVLGTITRTFATPKTLQSYSTTPAFPSSDAGILKQQADQYGGSTLVVPTGVIQPGDIEFGITIDGTQYKVSNIITLSWEAGKQYIYKIKLTSTGLSVSSITITQWDTVIGDDIVIY